MGQQSSKESQASVVGSTVRAVSGATGAAAGAVKDTAGNVKEVVGAVGAEDREAIRIQKKETWGRVEEGDTFWGLSEKYLGDATKWESLQAACSRELGTDPLLLLPGTHVTESCIARAKANSR